MVLRKLRKFFLIFLIGLLGIILMVFVILNLPFSQRFATRQVNQILNSSGVPIQLDAIRKIMPGSVNIQGIVITGLRGDTIIYAGELQADIRLVSLVRSKVMLKDLLLDGAQVELTRNVSEEKLNIAAAFQSGKPKEAVPLEKTPAKWEISIKKGALTNIDFHMDDSLTGIHIEQDASEIDLGNFLISLSERNIFCRSLYLGDADGLVSLTPRLIPRKKKKGSPWNMGFLKLALDDVDFSFSKPADSLKLETHIGKGSIRANKLDLLSRTADFKLISLDKSITKVQTGNASKKEKKQLDAKERPFRWRLLSESIEIKNSTARLGSEPWEIYREIDLQMSDLRLNKDQAGIKLKKMGFEMDNGFSLKKMSGELDSNRDQTRFQMEIKTANSRVEMIASAEEGYQDILAQPVEIAKATLDMKKSLISLRDLSYFMEDMEELPYYAPLLESQLNMEAKLNVAGPLFSLSECSVSQQENFNINLEGDINNPFQFPEATGDLDMEISNLDQAWLEKLAEGFGISQELPDLSDLKVHVSISDTLESPDIYVAVESQAGNVDLAGSLDFHDELFKLAYSFQRLALGDLLSVPDLDFFTGAGEVKGKGFSGENLRASFYLQVDTLGFKSYNYTHTQLTGTLEPGAYELQMVANDPSLKGDLNVALSLADSAFKLQASGIIQAQLDKLHFYDDTLAVKTSIDARLSSTGEALESEISVNGLTFTTPWETAVVQDLNASFESDGMESQFHADADFFNLDLQMLKPINELDSIGKYYYDYLRSFQKVSGITETNRVAALPEINGKGHFSYHNFIDIFVEDTSFYFKNLDVSITKLSDRNSLHAQISGDEMSYKMVKTGKLDAIVTDSAGIIIFELVADKTSLLSGPENRWTLNGDFSERSTRTRLFIDDYEDRNIYQIEVAGKMDSSQLVLEIPSQLLTLNGELWQLERPDLLSIDLTTNAVFPSLQMKRDSSFFHLDSRRQDQLSTYNLELKEVELGALIRNDFFTGKPEGTFTGSVEFRTNRDTDKKVATAMQISDVRFSGQDLSDIQLDAELERGKSNAYLLDFHARSDSFKVQVSGKKTEGGDMNMDGEFSHLLLATIEPFADEYLSELGGSISGNFNLTSRGGSERFDAEFMLEDVLLKVNMLNSAFRIPTQGIVIADERLILKQFTILDTLNRPLHLDGFVDFSDRKHVMADLNITSKELQVMSRDNRRGVPFTGNVFIDSRISIKGPLRKPDIAGNLLLSEGTEIFYHHMEDLRMTETEKIVNFVQPTSTGEEIKPILLDRQNTLLSSSVETIIEIDPSTMVNFTLEKRMFDIYLNVKGGGNLQYNLENEQMALTGLYEIGEGATLLKLVGWPDKSFRLTEGGFIRWNGMVENPDLSIEAESKVASSYVNPIDGKSRDVDFFVILQLSGYLSDLDVVFTIRTPDQYVMSIINTMSPEEQMRQAITVLLFETIDLPGISSSSDYMTQQVNQILSSQLNQFTKSTIKGVDISFGLNTYDQSLQDGGDETTTSLSYEVRKSLLNNRAQIEFSGRVNNDNQQSGATDHSLNNISFEYQLDSAATKYLKVYNEHSYDDVFEGEVIKTGIGFTYKKRYKTLSDIWRRKK